MNKMMHVLAAVAAITILIGPSRAHARLGESEQQLKQRYGDPIKAEPVDKFRRLAFDVQKKYLVFVILQDDKSILEIFTKIGDEPTSKSDAQAMVTTLADGKQTVQLPESTVEAIASRALGGFETEAGWAIGDTFAMYSPAGILLWFKDMSKAREWLTVAQKEQAKGL